MNYLEELDFQEYLFFLHLTLCTINFIVEVHYMISQEFKCFHFPQLQKPTPLNQNY